MPVDKANQVPDQAKLPAWTPPQNAQEAASTILRLGRDIHQNAYSLGRTLIWVKKQIGHGKFALWIKENVWFGERTARNMMSFTRRCEREHIMLEYHPNKAKGSTVADLPATKRKQDEDAAAKALAQKISQYLESLTGKQRTKAIPIIAGALDKYRGAEIVALPEWLDPQAWDSYRQYRIENKKRMSAHTEALALKRLAELRAQGCDPVEVIEQSIVSGWAGLFAVKKQPPSPEDKLRQVLTRGL